MEILTPRKRRNQTITPSSKGIRTPVTGLEPAEQHQYQHDDQHEADAAAAVIAGAIERPATNAAKATSKMIMRTMSRIVPSDMVFLPNA